MAARFAYKGRDGGDSRRAVLPELPATLPHDIRKEINWVDYSNPVNPLGTPKVFMQALHTAIVDGELAVRPDVSGYALRRIMAAYNEVPIESVLVGTSPSSCIRDIVSALGPSRVGVAVPCPVEYELAIINGGSDFIALANPFSFATCKFYIAYREINRFDAALLSNPGYPSSRLLTQDILEDYLENCRWVIVDESYLELSLGGESFIPLTKKHPNLVIIRNPSATFAIPGMPISCIFAHPDTIKRLMSYTDPSCNGMAADVLAAVFPQLMGYLERTHEYLEREIPWLQCMLSLIPGVRIFPAEGNFVLCKFDGSHMDLGVSTSDELSVRLQLAGLLVPQLTRVSGLDDQESYFCIAAQRRDTDQLLLETMKKIVAR
ncbi:MAG: hypothetical protein Q3963_06430 [Coriobacteriaceae bacterium]|nr:hypothetical protein [Coriobacteriaceae bacterium]